MGNEKDFEMVIPSRRLIREGTFVKISKGNHQERQFFLFNDLLLYTSKGIFGKRKPEYRGMIPIEFMLINNLADSSSLFSVSFFCFFLFHFFVSFFYSID
jgi:hypothetical protein